MPNAKNVIRNTLVGLREHPKRNYTLLSLSQAQKYEELSHVQIGSEAHPASYPMGTAHSFPGGKAARA
jgi:hypothetical protein